MASIQPSQLYNASHMQWWSSQPPLRDKSSLVAACHVLYCVTVSPNGMQVSLKLVHQLFNDDEYIGWSIWHSEVGSIMQDRVFVIKRKVPIKCFATSQVRVTDITSLRSYYESYSCHHWERSLNDSFSNKVSYGFYEITTSGWELRSEYLLLRSCRRTSIVWEIL